MRTSTTILGLGLGLAALSLVSTNASIPEYCFTDNKGFQAANAAALYSFFPDMHQTGHSN